MNWKELTIGKKIGIGFGLVLILLTIVGIVSYTGTRGIVFNAEEVIDGNKLDGNLAQKEVDHLNWANKVNALLTDEKVTRLEAETDHTKCAFGKWLYGDGRKEAEHLVPSLAPLFKEIEAPHKALHDSAVAIAKVYRQADPELPTMLVQREADHLKWACEIRDAFVQGRDKLGVQLDPTLCGLGKWLNSQEAKKAYEKGDADFKKVWDEMAEVHGKLHHSAVDIEKNLKYLELKSLAEKKAGLHQIFERENTALFTAIDKAMASIIDPAKSRAEESGNGAELAIWGPIDMLLNEQVIQPFLKAQVAMADFEHEKTDALWEKCKTQIAQFGSGVKEWIELSKKAPGLGQTAESLDRIGRSWTENAEVYHTTIVAERDAEDSVKQAISLFDKTTIPLLNETMGHLEELKAEATHELNGMNESSKIYAEQTIPALSHVQGLLGKMRKEAKAHIMTDDIMLNAAQKTELSVVVLVAVALVIGILLAFFMARGIIKVLTGISQGLGEGANQVAAAAGQVSSSSQSMAEGASQQAAAIEETSSSMEEMSSMTKKNAENAGHADGLMKKTNEIVTSALQTMTQLIQSMEEISQASEETSKIIKTIDEIAFQTNLLALNAAVEAARAGEAGAGFAVVADEVRNLAMRAAEAAKTTSELISSTVHKVETGSELVSRTNEAFGQVTESASKVGSLIAEISEASEEQSRGIDQVNLAISEMDRVVQHNAANAEESASAAEEMNAQAEQLKEYVDDLVMIVTGKRGTGTAQLPPPSRSGALEAPHRKKVSLKPVSRKKEIGPGQVLDDDAFNDF